MNWQKFRSIDSLIHWLQRKVLFVHLLLFLLSRDYEKVTHNINHLTSCVVITLYFCLIQAWKCQRGLLMKMMKFCGEMLLDLGPLLRWLIQNQQRWLLLPPSKVNFKMFLSHINILISNSLSHLISPSRCLLWNHSISLISFLLLVCCFP